MLTLNSSRLKKFVEELLHHNETFNMTDIVNLIMGRNNLSNLSMFNQESDYMECGGDLKDVAFRYGKHYHPYVAIMVCVFGTVSNMLNIVVLTRKDMACAPINRILTALAVADMLLMVEYIPYACYYHLVLWEKRDFPYAGAVCMLLHVHVTIVLHTVSICLTLTLAIWRYLAIRYPERSHILCSDRRCTAAIFISFILPVVLCIPSYFTFTIRSKEIMEDKLYTLYITDMTDLFKKESNLLKIQFWIYGVLIKLLPCCILTVISVWLIRTLFRAKKRKQVLRGYDSFPLTLDGKEIKKKVSRAERRADRTTKMLIAVLILFLITEFPQGIFALLIAMKGKDLFLKCYQFYGELMDILALINGAINFILYCCMNRMFRTTFGQLFKYKILAQWAPAPPPEVHSTTVEHGTNATEL